MKYHYPDIKISVPASDLISFSKMLDKYLRAYETIRDHYRLISINSAVENGYISRTEKKFNLRKMKFVERVLTENELRDKWLSIGPTGKSRLFGGKIYRNVSHKLMSGEYPTALSPYFAFLVEPDQIPAGKAPGELYGECTVWLHKVWSVIPESSPIATQTISLISTDVMFIYSSVAKYLPRCVKNMEEFIASGFDEAVLKKTDNN